jgi:hypothetical protein
MKKTSYTPGPWAVDDPCENNKQHGPGGEQIFKVVSERGGLIADVSSWWVDTDSARKNARLIAAAPEMLDALKNMLVDAYDAPVPSVFKSHRMAAESAIKKALGE